MSRLSNFEIFAQQKKQNIYNEIALGWDQKHNTKSIYVSYTAYAHILREVLNNIVNHFGHKTNVVHPKQSESKASCHYQIVQGAGLALWLNGSFGSSLSTFSFMLGSHSSSFHITHSFPPVLEGDLPSRSNTILTK